MRRLAFTDALTGLPNRSQLDLELRAGGAARAPGRRAVALLFIDLDNFKLVNDSLGHAAGDRLLRRVAGASGASSEPDGLLARHGGDEFLCCSPTSTPRTPRRRPARPPTTSPSASPSRSRSRARSSTSRPASASRCSPATRTARTRCSSTPTRRCTRARAAAGAASTVYARMTHDPLERLSLSSAAAARDRRRRAGAALPADRVDGERAAALDGGAAALERPRARARAPRPLHPGRRGDEPARPDRRVGGRRDWRARCASGRRSGWSRACRSTSPRASCTARTSRSSCPSGCTGAGVDPRRLTMELTESATLREPERIGPLLRELHG